jgi:hypothetical protein
MTRLSHCRPYGMVFTLVLNDHIIHNLYYYNVTVSTVTPFMRPPPPPPPPPPARRRQAPTCVHPPPPAPASSSSCEGRKAPTASRCASRDPSYHVQDTTNSQAQCRCSSSPRSRARSSSAARHHLIVVPPHLDSRHAWPTLPRCRRQS